MKQITIGGITAITATLALVACDDHSFVPDDEGPVVTAAGVYSGSLTNDPAGATDFTAIVLDDGSFWTLYGQAGVSTFIAQGFARGSGISDGSAFVSTAATDFGFTPPVALTLEASYDAGAGTIEGTYTTVSGTTEFVGGDIPDSSYTFQNPASLTQLTGTWDVQDMDGTLYTLDVAADGTFELAEQGGGCTGSGTFAPHDSDRGVFAVTVNYDDVVECTNQAGSASGIALAYTYTGALTDQLLVAVNDGTAFGMTLAGTRPSP
jgi:hypothetical protein